MRRLMIDCYYYCCCCWLLQRKFVVVAGPDLVGHGDSSSFVMMSSCCYFYCCFYCFDFVLCSQYDDFVPQCFGVDLRCSNFLQLLIVKRRETCDDSSIDVRLQYHRRRHHCYHLRKRSLSPQLEQFGCLFVVASAVRLRHLSSPVSSSSFCAAS